MALKITAENVEQIAEDMWKLELPPHEVRLFGAGAKTIGPRSILLLKNYEFDKGRSSLSFDLEDALALNIGTTTGAIAVSTAEEKNQASVSANQEGSRVSYGPGDQEFLALARDLLSPPMAHAAEALLAGVRQRTAGELKRGKQKNFSDTPDNFWYVIVQPQIQQLSITVRGPVDHFEPIAELPIKDDRGNTLFKVTSEADVPAALNLIFHAKRKHTV